MTKLLWPVSWKGSIAFHRNGFVEKGELSFECVKLKCLQDIQVGIKARNYICESRIGH